MPNDLSYRDQYPIPRMNEWIDSLGDTIVFITPNAYNSFWKIPLRDEYLEKTVFTTHVDLFEFICMPFGLKNVPRTFQRALDIALSGFTWKTCSVYIDDLVIFSRSEEDYLDQVDKILSA